MKNIIVNQKHLNILEGGHDYFLELENFIGMSPRANVYLFSHLFLFEFTHKF